VSVLRSLAAPVGAMPVATVAVAVTLSGLLASCSGSNGSDLRTVQVFDPAERVPAPSIAGPSLNGGVINLRNYTGRVVVLNFWGSWCPPCRAEQAKLNAVYTADHARGVDFVGVDVRDDNTAARSFLRNHSVRYPSIVDQPASISLEFDPRLPTEPPITVIVDRQGRVAAKILGPADQGVLQPLVEQFAAERAA
jgi:thiol-disulfide isomerase/thioredoxin